MPWITAGAIAGSAVIGGVMQSGAAKDAARAQGDAAKDAMQLQREQWAAARADNAPFLASGTAANKRLAMLLGIGDPGDGSGSLLRKFSADDLNADPVYQSGLQFGLDEGTKGINARATASGMYDSGATLKALTRFASDFGSTKAGESYNRYTNDQNNIFNRLSAISGTGQVASNQIASAGTNAANSIGASMEGAGNARAASIIGGAQAWGNAINSGTNYYTGSKILDKILASRGMNNQSSAVDPNSYYNG